MTNKIIIAGGTGFIGRHIAEWFAPAHEVVILSRNRSFDNNAIGAFAINEKFKANIRLVEWDGKNNGEWTKEIDGAHMVINLAGKSVNCRYTARNKKEIFDSRTHSTEAIGTAIRSATTPPKVWINAASATIYRHALDKPQDELTGEMKNDFSVQVCKRWEETFFAQRTPFTRKVAFRMAITLGAGGVMVPYLNLVKFGLGGKQGSGKQMFNWVHIEDVCRAVDFVNRNDAVEGVYNLCSPNPVSNATFMKSVRDATGAKFGLPAYEWMLKIGAAIIGTETELILKSRWVVPSKLTSAGFEFQFPNLEDAMKNIVFQLPRFANKPL